MPQVAHIAIGDSTLCEWSGCAAGAEKVRAASQVLGKPCTCGHGTMASAQRAAKVLRPHWKRGVVRVVRGPCPVG